jgi:hypothetical protein
MSLTAYNSGNGRKSSAIEKLELTHVQRDLLRICSGNSVYQLLGERKTILQAQDSLKRNDGHCRILTYSQA